ncbi:MAG: DUF4252 domain-containing protein [Bacteroidales bacterium]|nr:DUF4252 domain-containing protein [Bacteroidales bacterium]
MKKSIVKFILGVLISFPLMAMAQTPIDKLYEKYAGKEGFTSVNISPQMFGLFSEMDVDEDDETGAMKKAVKEITGMKILSYEPKDGQELINFKEEVEKTLDLEGFEELMVVDSEDGGVKFLVKKKKDKILEFLMLAGEDDEYTVMSFVGNMDIETIGQLSKQFGMDQMGGAGKDK